MTPAARYRAASPRCRPRPARLARGSLLRERLQRSRPPERSLRTEGAPPSAHSRPLEERTAAEAAALARRRTPRRRGAPPPPPGPRRGASSAVSSADGEGACQIPISAPRREGDAKGHEFVEVFTRLFIHGPLSIAGRDSVRTDEPRYHLTGAIRIPHTHVVRAQVVSGRQSRSARHHRHFRHSASGREWSGRRLPARPRTPAATRRGAVRAGAVPSSMDSVSGRARPRAQGRPGLVRLGLSEH